MKLHDQICSLHLAIQLKNLGVEQNSRYFWYKTWHYFSPEYKISKGEKNYRRTFSAFTVAELGEMLPNDYVYGKDSWGKFCCWSESNILIVNTVYEDEKLANAIAKMLIYLLKNNLFKESK